MDLFDNLVAWVCEHHSPIGGNPADDQFICMDLDMLQDLKPTQRPALLRKAKREALRRYLDDEVDLIRETAENDEDVSRLLANFIPDDFDGRDPATPRGHALLRQAYYGVPLSESDIRRWTKAALTAARPQGDEVRIGGVPVVYFVSLGDPAMIKIGFSANFKHRLRSLRTASPLEPHVHLTLTGDRRLEVEFHERFRSDHVRREWYRLSPEIRAFIAEKTKE